MPEWLKGLAWKASEAEVSPGVQIPLPPLLCGAWLVGVKILSPDVRRDEIPPNGGATPSAFQIHYSHSRFNLCPELPSGPSPRADKSVQAMKPCNNETM